MASSPHQEQQQQEQSAQERQEEYLAAQRAAVEAVYVGRATLEQSVQQGEQLRRAEAIGEETQYKLDKAGRILRGMTWSGWVANMFTKPVAAPPEASVKDDVPAVYEGLPQECEATAQAIQNYHANVKVLEECETDEQKETCITICDTMFDAATDALDALKRENPKLEAYSLQFEHDLEQLRKRQTLSQQQVRQLGHIPPSPGAAGTSAEDRERAELFSTNSSKKAVEPSAKKTVVDVRQQEQDNHLAIMAQSLGELGSIAQNLQQSIDQQSHTIDSLDNLTDNITEKSRTVTRRADRVVQKRSWTPVKPTFHGYVTIRHIKSGRYLAALDAKDLYLVPKFHPLTCVFALWKRQGTIFGIKNKHSSRWVGQSLLGSLACSATSFGRREEWETGDDDWSKTRLLCASAGWGAGGYMHVREKDFALLIAGCSVEDRNNADMFQILEQESDTLPTELQD